METWVRLITIETDSPERMQVAKEKSLVREGEMQSYGDTRIFAAAPPTVPTAYNIFTDQIEPVTQDGVDNWTHMEGAYGELRQALARAEAERVLDPASALSDLLREAEEIQTKLQGALAHG